MKEITLVSTLESSSEGNARYRDNLAKVTQEIEAYTNRAFSYLLVSFLGSSAFCAECD